MFDTYKTLARLTRKKCFRQWLELGCASESPGGAHETPDCWSHPFCCWFSSVWISILFRFPGATGAAGLWCAVWTPQVWIIHMLIDLLLGLGSSQTGRWPEAENRWQISPYWEVCCEEGSALLPLLACPCEAHLASPGICFYVIYYLYHRNTFSTQSTSISNWLCSLQRS
jgi:hypothetical protein